MSFQELPDGAFFAWCEWCLASLNIRFLGPLKIAWGPASLDIPSSRPRVKIRHLFGACGSALLSHSGREACADLVSTWNVFGRGYAGVAI